jgi:hypothetical protein
MSLNPSDFFSTTVPVGQYTVYQNQTDPIGNTYNFLISFTGNGTVTFNQNSKGSLIIVGGGAGGNAGYWTITDGSGGTGGGGGSVIYESAILLLENNSYSITVGAGGLGGIGNNVSGNPGENTIFSTYNASGGVVDGGGIGGSSSNGSGSGSNSRFYDSYSSFYLPLTLSSVGGAGGGGSSYNDLIHNQLPGIGGNGGGGTGGAQGEGITVNGDPGINYTGGGGGGGASTILSGPGSYGNGGNGGAGSVNIYFNGITGYSVNNIDLNKIFQPLSPGEQQAIVTNYNSNGQDLNTFFAPYTGGTKAITTRYSVPTYGDLNNIFLPILSLFNTTSELISTTHENYVQGTLASNFYIPNGYTYFNFAIYGGGGNGNTGVGYGYGTGGGGSGGYIQALSIPYSPSSGIIIDSITYGISGGGQSMNNTYVTVNYNNSTNIDLQAGQGYTTVNGQGSGGSAGGSAAVTNSTSFYDPAVPNIVLLGDSGGDQGANGTSNNRYTSSGSGASGDSTGSPPAGQSPTVSNTYKTPDGQSYTLTSTGGGIDSGGNSVIPSGYGAGGAAFGPPYQSGTDYKTYISTPGAILFWLS